MNKRIIPFLALTIITFPTFGDQSFGFCEKGDLVFRDGPVIVINCGHTGIYCDWANGNPVFTTNQKVVEATTVGDSICREITLHDFQTENTFWGVKSHKSDPYFYQREAIVEFVRTIVDEEIKYHFKKYKGPDTYRCDGLAEAAYESQGLNIVDDINFMTLAPILQFHSLSMKNARGISPVVLKTYPEDGDVVEGKITIMAEIDESLYGSELRQAKFFIDGSLLKIDTTKAQIVHTYKAEWNVNSASERSHYIKILAYDNAGNIGEKRIKVYKGKAPFIVSTVPSDGTPNASVDISVISITFSKPMDQSSTSGAVSIEPDVSYTTSWENERILNLNLSDTLDYCEEYTASVSDVAMDTAHIHLDGDEDGEPGGDYIFFFNIQPPSVNHQADPSYHTFLLPGDRLLNGKVEIEGNSLKKELSCNLSKTVKGDISALGFNGGTGVFTIPPGESDNTPFTVFASEPGHIYVNLDLKSQSQNCLNKIALAAYSAIDTTHKDKPGHDHPDENQSPGLVTYPTECRIEPDSVYREAEIGIFPYGWSMGFGHLLGKYGISITPVFSDLKYWKNPYPNLSEVIHLLVIGSGALSGFNSPQFKQGLADYVQNGGNLLVLTQKFGSDFSVLPGEIDGYGWCEDQSCFKNAAYLNEWHPVFSGQEKEVMSCNIDGYLSQYPDYVNVLLRRTANGMPALLSYSYGAGTVIVSSLYSDWGYGHNQTSSEELRLLRDLTTWALNPEMPIPEFYPDSSVSVPVSIEYTAEDTVEATTAIVKVYTPDRELYNSSIVSISLQSGKETQWVWNNPELSKNLGIWVINYALMDNNGSWIQGYRRGAIFAQRMNVPTGNYNLGNFQLWAASDKEELFPGDTVNFELFVRNNTDSSFTGKVIVGVHEERDEGGVRWEVIDSITGLSIPSDTVISVIYKKPLWISTSTYFGFYQSDQFDYNIYFPNALSRTQKGAWVKSQPLPISLSLDKDRYTPYITGYDTVHYTAEISNEVSYPCSLQVELYTILDSLRYDIRLDTINLASSDKVVIEGGFFPFDYNPTSGREELCCDVYYRDSLWNSKRESYNLIFKDVKCSISLPDSFNYNGSNPFTVTLSSEGDYFIPGKLFLTGKDHFDSLSISWSPNPETTLTFNYRPDKWHLKDWIKAEYKYGNQKSSAKKDLSFSFPSHCPIAISPVVHDNIFLPGDTAQFSGWVKGRGKLYEAPVIGWVVNCPLGGDTLFDTTIVNPGKMKTLSFETYIDTTVPPEQWYQYDIGLKYLDGFYGGSVVPGYMIQSPVAWLHWPYNDTVSITDHIPMTYSNPIKTTAKVGIDSALIYDNGVFYKDLGPGEVAIPPESSYTYQVDIPAWTSGKYNVKFYSEVTKGEGYFIDLFSKYGCPIFINGIESQFTVNSKKDWYNQDEDVTITSLVDNGDFAYQGLETLSIYPFEETTQIFNLGLGPKKFLLYGMRIEVDNSDSVALIDSLYSLRVFSIYLIDSDDWGHYITPDDCGNIWLFSFYTWEKSWGKKFNRDFSEILQSFQFPDTLGDITDLALKGGWLYLSDGSKGKIRKISTSTGELVDSWGLGDGSFPSIRGISISDDGKVIAVDDVTKRLYQFTPYGELVDSFNLPSSLNYNDLEFSNGKTYISAGDRILTFREGVIDTFCVSDTIGYSAISVAENGKVAVLDEKEVILYSEEGEVEDSLSIMDDEAYDLCFIGEDLLIPWRIPQGPCLTPEKKQTVRRDDNFVSRFREFGKDKGMIVYYSGLISDIFPDIYTFLDYYPDDNEPGTGSISYKARYGNDTEVPLGSLKGTHYLPKVEVELVGNYLNSPIFRNLGLEVRALAKDTLIYENTHELSLQLSEEMIITDSIQDSLPPGDYSVFGNLHTTQSQLVNSGINYFTVVGDGISLLMRPDTTDVPTGWTFHPLVKVVNPLPDLQENLHFTLRTEDSLYLDTTFSMDSNEVDSFPLEATAYNPTTLSGKLILPTNDTIKKDITLNVMGGIISLSVSAPDIVNLKPFAVKSEVKNLSMVTQEVVLKKSLPTNLIIDTLQVPAGEIITTLDSLCITRSETLEVVASGGFDEIRKELPINFGIKSEVSLNPEYQVGPDSVEMSGIIKNDGSYPLKLKALFCLMDSESSRKSRETLLLPDARRVGKELSFTEFVEKVAMADIDTSLSYIYLTPGKLDTIPIMFDFHQSGDYQMKGYLFTDSISLLLDSASSSVKIIPNALVSVDSMILSENCDSIGSVPLSVLISNESYNSFFGSLTLSSSVCYLDTTVEIFPLAEDTIIFSLQDPVSEGRQKFIASLKEGGRVLNEKKTDLNFRPIYQFDSLPDELNFSIGDTGSLAISVRNIGNGKGERRVSAKWVDVINIDQVSVLKPGSLSVFKQVFSIPLDMSGGEYYCEVGVFDGIYPEVDTFFPVRINGAAIIARDSLDQPVYQNGDMAELSIIVENQAMWSGNLEASIQYGRFSSDTSFILGGMEKGICNEMEYRDTLFFDGGGIYMADPISTTGYDSIKVNRDVSSDSLIFNFRSDSVIGEGDWTSLDDGITYPIRKWMQIMIKNESVDTEWVNSLSLHFNPLDSVILDSFPLQREMVHFMIPVDSSQKKLGWGIYHPSGRSIILDERYIFVEDDSLTIFTDKGRYELLDTVNVTLWKYFPGINYDFHYSVYFSPSEILEDSFALFSDTSEFSFEVPDWSRSGTYSIDYWVVDGNTKANQTLDDISIPLKGKRISPAMQWVLGKPERISPDSAFITGSRYFDVDGITVYFKKSLMDANLYKLGDTARIWMDISSDVDLNCSLILSSTCSVKDTARLLLHNGIPNQYEFEYLISGMSRGKNELYLQIMKDWMSLAGEVLYFDVDIPDSTAPLISILEEPSNTYSSSKLHRVKARIWNPDSTDTPFYDTLYYRLISGGGTDWQPLLPNSIKGDTHQYFIPSQANGSLLQFHIVVQDSFGNLARYPEEGEDEFWVLSAMKPTWSELIYTRDTSVLLSWNPPEELLSYHCNLVSDTVPLGNRIVATRFIPQCIPARLNKFGIKFERLPIIQNGTPLHRVKKRDAPYPTLDTIIVHLYQVEDTLPMSEINSFTFTRDIKGWEEFDLPGTLIPEEGLFFGVSGPSDIGVIFDGFGRGFHTALYSDNSWTQSSQGEALTQASLTYLPTQRKRQSQDLSFDLYRSLEDSNWAKIASDVSDTIYRDATVEENRKYFYKIQALFSNPVKSFFSSLRNVFIDLKPPILDTVFIKADYGEDLLICATFKDTSGIQWDSLGYQVNDSIYLTGEDSSYKNEHYFSIHSAGDTLSYFFKASDSSLIGNYARYPDSGFYNWRSPSIVPEEKYPSSTYLANLPQNPITGRVVIKYALSEKSNVRIVLYDVLGRKIKTLIDKKQGRGYYSVPLTSEKMPQGVYFLRMTTGDYKRTLKLVKLL